MSNYDKLKSMVKNNFTNLDQLNTNEPDTISPTEFNGCNRRKVGRPKSIPKSHEDILLDAYKELEMRYNLLEIEHQIALNEIESLKLQAKKQELTKSMSTK